jgi:hypothetical protein
VCMLKRSGRLYAGCERVADACRGAVARARSGRVKSGQSHRWQSTLQYGIVWCSGCVGSGRVCCMSTCVSNVYVCQQPMACTICSIAEERVFRNFSQPMDGWVPPGLRPQAFIVVFRLSKLLDVRWVDTRAPTRVYGHARDRHSHNESGALVWAELGLSSVYRVKVLL